MLGIKTISRKDFETDIAWLAGFIDGEGCFYLGFNTAYDRQKPRKTMRTLIMIGNTVAEPIEKATRILCDHGVGFSSTYHKPDNPKWSPSIAIKICGQKRVQKLCELLLPYLSGKKENALQMIHAIRYRQELAEEFGGNNKNSALIDNPILQMMASRMKELTAFRKDLSKYSRIASKPFSLKKSSQAICLTALSKEDCIRKLRTDDMVGAAWRHAEAGGTETTCPA